MTVFWPVQRKDLLPHREPEALRIEVASPIFAGNIFYPTVKFPVKAGAPIFAPVDVVFRPGEGLWTAELGSALDLSALVDFDGFTHRDDPVAKVIGFPVESLFSGVDFQLPAGGGKIVFKAGDQIGVSRGEEVVWALRPQEAGTDVALPDAFLPFLEPMTDIDGQAKPGMWAISQASMPVFKDEQSGAPAPDPKIAKGVNAAKEAAKAAAKGIAKNVQQAAKAIRVKQSGGDSAVLWIALIGLGLVGVAVVAGRKKKRK